MNQDQRKFLIERVGKTFKSQVEKLEGQKVDKPSLNNYLIASFLDGTVQFNDINTLREKLRAEVLKFGPSDRLIESEDDDDNNVYWRRNKRRQKNYVKVPAEDLFVIPAAYTEELAKYNAFKKDLQGKIDQLEAQRDTIILKIQVGSNQVLDKLITQVDNMADLNIMNSQFLLGDAPKAIENK